MSRIRVYILSNDDVTSNVVFAPLFESDAIEVVGLAFSSTLLSKQGSGLFGDALALLKRTSWRYWLYQVFVNGAYKLRETLGISRGWPPSLRALARARGLDVTSEPDFGAASFLDRIRTAEPELVAIRVNQILTPELLDVPALGTWCVHSSLLPGYRGIAGELHSLRQGDGSVGSTVFEVEVELDRGAPLVQRRIPVANDASVFGATVANNVAAGALLRSAVEEYGATGQLPHELDPAPPASSYFSWPSPDDLAQLRARGRRLIRIHEAVAYLACSLGLKRVAPSDQRSIT